MKTQAHQVSTLLEKIHSLVLENIHNEQFGTAELADQLGLSRSTLHRRLKAESGYSTSRFMRRIRLNKAMELLKSSSDNISQIALESGFHSISYFTKCFREEFGYTPRKIRSGEVPEREENMEEATLIKNRLHYFPNYASSFIGRHEGMRTIDQLLDDHRLISLLGPGGSGKTRLACETLSRTEIVFPEGIWFVDLASLEKGEFLDRKLLETLQIPEVPGMNLSDTLAMNLSDREMLIVLDNCEHVLSACQTLVKELFTVSNTIRILTTSRETLHLEEGEEYHVSPLPYMEPESVINATQAKASEAILLFEDRARASDSRFELVNENAKEVAAICQKLDGIPLALELLASRIRHMDPVTMLERMSGRFSQVSHSDVEVSGRQKTLLASIEWSSRLLSQKERLLFKRLAIFPGTFDLEAVEHICADSHIVPLEILDLLSNLLDRSMVQSIRSNGENMRYQLLETLREYAFGELHESESKQLRGRYLEYYLTMAQQAYNERLDAQSIWMTRLQLEHHNLLSALSKAEIQGQIWYASLSSLLIWFWSRSNNYRLAKEIIEKALSLKNTSGEVLARIYAGYAQILGVYPDELEKGIAVCKKAIELWSRLGNTDEEAIALADLALAYFGSLDDPSGLQSAQKAYERALINGDKGILLYCMLPLSQGFVHLKQFAEARTVAGQIIKAGEELQNLHAQFGGHHHIADCALMQEEYIEAEKEYGRGIEICQSYGDFIYICVDVSGVAMAVAGQGRYAKAIRLIEAINKITENAGMITPEAIPMSFWQELIEKHIRITRKELGDRLSEQYGEEGRKLDLEAAVEYALDFEKD